MGNSYRDLLVWQKARSLAVRVYKDTQLFPKHELYGLSGQMRRAAVSVASNIAEGQGRLTSGEFIQFLGNARGSLLELETQLTIAHDLEYLTDAQHQLTSNETRKLIFLLNRLITAIPRSQSQGCK